MNDDDTPAVLNVGHDANRELLAAIGNLLMEARQHTVALEHLYQAVRAMQAPASGLVAHNLIAEERRHEQKTSENLAGLTALVEA